MQDVTDLGLRPGSLGALRSTLGLRYWFVAGVASLAALIVLGIPTAVIPNPFFARMTPTEDIQVVIWLVSAPLIGLLIATYVRPSPHPVRHPHAEPGPGSGAGRATLGGVAAYLAIGCPICNKVVVATLGVSGALNVFAPLQPLIGAGSVVLLAATLAWRLRARARRCERCAAPTAPSG